MPTMTDEQIGNRMDWKVSIEGVKIQKLHNSSTSKIRPRNNGYNFAMFRKWKGIFQT